MLFNEETNIPLGSLTLKGELYIPNNGGAIVVFSNGSGSSRFSRRNQLIRKYFQERNFGTLLFDLLTEIEDQEHSNRFNIGLLTSRLIEATNWLQTLTAARDRQICYFGAATGAAAALKAAVSTPYICAVVSRGGRLDLVMKELPQVKVPTMLVVGGHDQDVLDLNRKAYMRLNCKKELVVIPGATHFFEEPGAMDKVSEQAAAWFEEFSNVASPALK